MSTDVVVGPGNSPYTVSSGQTDFADVVVDGTMAVLSGGVISSTMIFSGGFLTIDAGGSGSGTMIAGQETVFGLDQAALVLSTGTSFVSGGGTASGTTVSAGGTEIVFSGGLATHTSLTSGGLEVVSSGGTSSNTTVSSGGILELTGPSFATYTLLAGATLEVASGAVPSNVSVGKGVTEDILSGATAGVTVNSGTVNVSDGATLALRAAVVNNGGAINLLGSNTGATLSVDPAAGGTVTLSGGGTISMSSSGDNAIIAGATGVTLINHTTIVGAGTIGTGNANLTFKNSGTVDASDSSTAITIATGSNTVTNGGTIEATAEGTVAINALFDNTGTVDATGLGGVVEFDNVHNTGMIEASTSAIDGSVATKGDIAVNSGTILAAATGAFVFAGIELQAITNSRTVEAEATALHGEAAVLIASGGTNAGTIEATDAGAVSLAEILLAGALDNTGTVLATALTSGGSAWVQLNNTVISGGQLRTVGADAGIGEFTAGFSGTIADATVDANSIVVASSGGTLSFSAGKIETGAFLRAVNGGTLGVDGAVTNSGTIEALATSGTTDVNISGTVSNGAGIILASGGSGTVSLDGATILGGKLETSGGGTVSAAANSLNLFSGATITSGSLVDVANGATLTLEGTLADSGTLALNGQSAAAYLNISGNVMLTGGGQVQLSSSGDNVIGAVASSGTLTNVSDTITGDGLIGGNNALKFVNSGTVLTSADLNIETGSNSVTNAAKGTLEATSGGVMNVLATFDNAGLVEAASAGLMSISGTLANSGIIEASGAGTVLLGGTLNNSKLIETLSGGTAEFNGTVNNSGAVFASGADSLIEVFDGATLSGGVTEIGEGIVDIGGSSGENITFETGGTGGLELGDAVAYGGTISGFGQNTHQFIDLTDVTSNTSVSLSYASSTASSGVLTVTSGATVVASLDMSGHYTSASFHLTSGSGGTVEIVDPPVVEQKPGNAPATVADNAVLEIDTADSGKVTFAGSASTLWLDQPGSFTGTVAGLKGDDGIDLPSIAFGANTTLAYSENASRTGGTLTMTDGGASGAQAATTIALLGNYMAASFATAADGHGGTLITASPQTANEQALLTEPHK